MLYLGGLRGAGVLTAGVETVARADYDFDGFLLGPGRIASSGEIRMQPEALRDVFGRTDLHLLTDDGRKLNLRFSEKRLASPSNAAHVDVTGELPSEPDWRH